LNDGVMADDANLLLDALRAHYGIEEDRSQSFNNRGASLAALGSVVLSLLTFAVSSDVRPDAASVPSTAKALIVPALWLLVIAIAVVLIGVLRPRRVEDVINSLSGLQGRAPEDVREELISNLLTAGPKLHALNHEKSFWLAVAGVMVTVAVALSAVAGTVIAL
jgi:hypothetical protein